MKRQTKQLLFYVCYLVFVIAVTTTALLALRGRCYLLSESREIVYVECDCNCDSFGRDSQGRCTNCKHYVVPKVFEVEPPAFAKASAGKAGRTVSL